MTPAVNMNMTFLTPLVLRAFNPVPDYGTLFGPSLGPPSLPPGMSPADADHLPPTRLIDNPEAASDLEMVSVILMGEAEEWVNYCREQGMRAPYRLPQTDYKGTPWYVRTLQAQSGKTAARLIVETQSPHRTIEIDMSNSGSSRYSYGIHSSQAEFVQSILINTATYEASTDLYTAQIRGVRTSNAFKLALELSSALYSCGQYDWISELGPLEYRAASQEEWTELFFQGRRFISPDIDLTLQEDVTFASAATVFGETGSLHRQSVMSIDLNHRSDELWDVDVTLYRPPHRNEPLMPLADRLIRVLWEPIFKKIFYRTTFQRS